MATYNKFQGFVGYLGLGTLNLNTDTLRVYLSNAAPSASADDVKADLAEIATGTDYTGAIDTQNTYSETTGTGTCGATDITITANTPDVATFQYVVLFDDTHASKILIAWWDYGGAVSLGAGESFNIDFQANTLFTIV